MNKQLFIIGAGSVGGHIALNLEEYGLLEYNSIAFLDDNPKKHSQTAFGFPVLGNVNQISTIEKEIDIVIGIAFPTQKIPIVEKLTQNVNITFLKLIARSAWISKSVEVGQGSIIYPGTSINYSCKIGSFVVLNMNCAIGHDCKIGDYTSLAPGVNLSGHTRIGKYVDVGIGASTIQDIIIGDNCVIGGQSMIISNIPSDSKIVGVPGRSI